MYSISPNITEIIAIAEDPIVTPAQLGKWLNLSDGMVTLQTDLLQELIDMSIPLIEEYAWIYLRRTTFEAYFDLPYNDFLAFVNGTMKLSLERAPILALTDITKIEYLDENGVWQLFDKGTVAAEGIYENVTEKKEQRDWASVFFKEAVPFDSSRFNAYKVRITFIAGYTPPETDPVTDIPKPLIVAIKQIAAHYYTNRGDCSSDCSMNGSPVPCGAKALVDRYSIAKTTLGGSYTPSQGGYYGLC